MASEPTFFSRAFRSEGKISHVRQHNLATDDKVKCKDLVSAINREEKSPLS
jgi:hypothetical protein